MSRAYVIASITVQYRSVVLPAHCPGCKTYLDAPKAIIQWSLEEVGLAYTSGTRPELATVDEPGGHGDPYVEGIAYSCAACGLRLAEGPLTKTHGACCCKGSGHSGVCCRGWKHDGLRQAVRRCLPCQAYPTDAAAERAHASACACGARAPRAAA